MKIFNIANLKVEERAYDHGTAEHTLQNTLKDIDRTIREYTDDIEAHQKKN